MKVVFAEAKYKGKVKLGKEVEKLPERIALITTVQFADSLDDVKKEIERSGKKVILKKGKQKYKGMVLGCESSAAPDEKLLYIGTGKFHPLNAALQTNKDVYLFNPFDKKITKLSKKDIDSVKRKKQAALLKYHSADSIGILVTIKPGQYFLKKAMKFKKKLEKQGKKAYIFIDNTINFDSLENFPFIKAWVNTACPRIIEDFSAVYIDDLE